MAGKCHVDIIGIGLQCLMLFSIIMGGNIFKEIIAAFYEGIRSFRRNIKFRSFSWILFTTTVYKWFFRWFQNYSEEEYAQEYKVDLELPSFQGKNFYTREAGSSRTTKQFFNHSFFGVYQRLGLAKQNTRNKKSRRLADVLKKKIPNMRWLHL